MMNLGKRYRAHMPREAIEAVCPVLVSSRAATFKALLRETRGSRWRSSPRVRDSVRAGLLHRSISISIYLEEVP